VVQLRSGIFCIIGGEPLLWYEGCLVSRPLPDAHILDAVILAMLLVLTFTFVPKGSVRYSMLKVCPAIVSQPCSLMLCMHAVAILDQRTGHPALHWIPVLDMCLHLLVTHYLQ
jgi:hypothetical protein